MKTEIKPLVELNINPCKMCMPLGVVTALYGIRGCMTILHGSQGCSTYIRRHMATHYNEPVDIASSSLTEEGTVYGGEENLMKGLHNLIQLYHPEVIGVSTTCLAETIGEDIERIIDKFYKENPQYKHIFILPVHSPGYGNTQYEGYFNALYQIVTKSEQEEKKHQKINVITGPISPADTRCLKELFAKFDLEIILLPDLSENLDGVYKETYDRLPGHGTAIGEIRQMAGSAFTIELTGLDTAKSIGKYLYQNYQIPYQRLNLPIGLRDTDTLCELLSELSGKEIPDNLKKERGRYLDAMIDSHKYNAQGRAAIFGEPDFVISAVRLCVENGIVPLIAATGSKCPDFKDIVKDEIKPVMEENFSDDYMIADDLDFKTIESWAKEYKVNLLIGNSDGRRMEESLHIPLVRRGFPIHDRIGGQRMRTLGFEGSLIFLDELSNALLSEKERSFRTELLQKYGQKYGKKKENVYGEKELVQKTETHPCFTRGSGKYARIHLPIAPKCNISCNYCLRKYDCPNESRPGVTTRVVSPAEALERFIEAKKRLPNLSVIGIAGPGDALANFDQTRETLRLIREYDPNITFCLSTNGLMLPDYARELIGLGVTHVTVTLNAVDTRISSQIYKFIDYKGKRYEGEKAARILLTNQLTGIRMLTAENVVCKINVVMLKGINDSHIPEVVEYVKDLGCYITNIMPMIPVNGSVFENIPQTNNKELIAMRKSCEAVMPQMHHCQQCRADAVGTLTEDQSIKYSKKLMKAVKPVNNAEKKVRFAVATRSGLLIDQHFGMVKELYIYEYKNGNAVFRERRNIRKYCYGADACEEQEKEDKISIIAKAIQDCDGVIAMRIGDSPTKKLEKRGIRVFTTYDRIEDAVKKAAEEVTQCSKLESAGKEILK